MLLTKFLEKHTTANASLVTNQLLKSLKIPVTTSTVVDELERHPDYPSLYSISDSLSKWKVENLALKVEPEKLEEIPTPFIAHSTRGGGNFILVNSVNGFVDFIDEKGRQRKTTKEEFQALWNNIVLLAEKNEQSGEKSYEKSRKKEFIDGARIPVIIGGIFLLIVLFFSIARDVVASSLLLLKLAGVVTASLLLWFEIDKNNPVVQQICSAGKKTNCTAVLSSKQSKLLNWISWSEVGFFYFTGSFLFLLLTANRQQSTLAVLSWLNLLALPYTVFSVSYQWQIAKQWCPLCLTVQAILVLEFVTCYFGFWHSVGNPALSLSKGELIPLLTSFSLPVFFWMATKKVYLNAQAGRQYRKELLQLKYNKQVFNALLSKQKQITTSVQGLGIVLGNPNAANTIIKVCNPYCGPCAKAHRVIDEILGNNKDVRVQIIFTAMNNENDIKSKPVKHLMALYEKEDEALIRQALDDWYLADKKAYDAFASKYLLDGELQNQGQKLEAMNAWCKESDIAFTPTFFVNGYQLPEIYKIEDLKHLI